MRTYISSFIAVFLISSLSLWSQSNAKYFDDGNISNAKNRVKLNLASAYVGDINLSYEYIINDMLGIEVGAGILMPYYNERLTRYEIIREPEGGFSWHASLRWYYREVNDTYFLYAAPLIRVRNYKQIFWNSPIESTVNFRDLGFVQGFQMSFSRIVIDAHGGAAFRDIKIDGEDFAEGITDDFAYIISLKIGYLF